MAQFKQTFQLWYLQYLQFIVVTPLESGMEKKASSQWIHSDPSWPAANH